MSQPAQDPDSQPALVIGGPTASGKTALALSIARKIGGAIVNADAFQLYAGLPILTAQPTPEQFDAAPHHLFGEIPLHVPVDAASYARLARERIRSCWKLGCPPILVGGSGLYLRAVIRGIAEGLPPPDLGLRAQLEGRSLSELCAELAVLDPESAKTIDLKNPRRVIRALEVRLLTGKTFSSFRVTPELGAPPAGIWLTLPREELHARIALRASKLFSAGVGAEVRTAIPLLGTTARQVIGIQQVSSALSGEVSPQEATKKIIEATRQYARRQETWFRKESSLLPTTTETAEEAALRLSLTRI